MEEVEINGKKYVLKSSIKAAPAIKLGKRVIVRCRDAGVHVGEIVSKEGDVVTLKNANRLFFWKSEKPRIALFTLSEVAMDGVCRKESKIGTMVPSIQLRDWCEIIPVKEGLDLTEVNNGFK